MFRADAKWGGDVNALERELRTKLVGEDRGDRKGVTQLANAISNVFVHQQSLIGATLDPSRRSIPCSSLTMRSGTPGF
jgi:hypothetical protein